MHKKAVGGLSLMVACDAGGPRDGYTDCLQETLRHNNA